MMHSVTRAGWMPTFALAKHNDSEGRKSRIRRSKDERKAMVESFIKKYQESNSGNFPSLNLTHKEVGGSFYTVREIVRDIIQENRVLGPAKFNLEDFNTEQFLEQNPLGSIARDPQSFPGASSNEDHPEHNKVPDTNGKLLSVSDSHYTEVEHQVVDNGNAIDVDHTDVTNKETIEATVLSDGGYTGVGLPVVDNGHVANGSHIYGIETKSVKDAIVSDGHFTGAEIDIVTKGHDIDASLQVDVTNKESIEAVVVTKENNIDGGEVDVINKESDEVTIPKMQESKPMVPIQNVEQELAATTMPLAKLNALSKDLIVETFPLKSVARTSNGIEGFRELRDSEFNGVEPTNNSTLLHEKFENDLGNNILKENSNPRHDAESANDSTQKEQVSASHQKAITTETNSQSQIEDEAKTNIQDGFQTEKLNKTDTEGSKPSDEADKYRLGGNSQRIGNTTVDRINLESWDGRSKSSSKKEHNPILALLKAIVNAFGKFLSE